MSMSSWHASPAATATAASSFLSLFDDDLLSSSPLGHSPLRSSPLSPSAPLTSDDPFDLLSAVAGPLPLSSPSPKRIARADNDKKGAVAALPRPVSPLPSSSCSTSPVASTSASPSLGAILSSNTAASSIARSAPHSVHSSVGAAPSSKRSTVTPASSHSHSHSQSRPLGPPSGPSGFSSAGSTSPALPTSRLSSLSLSSGGSSSMPPYLRTDTADMFFAPSAPGGPAASSQPSSAAPSPVSQLTSMDFGSLAGLSSPFWQSMTADDSSPVPPRKSSALFDDQLLPSHSGLSPALSSTAADGALQPTEAETVSFFSPIFWNASASSPPSSTSTTTSSSSSATPSHHHSSKHHRNLSQPSDLSSLSLSALSSLAGSPLTSPSPSPYARTRSNSNSSTINPFLFTPTTTSLPHPTNESPFAATAPATILPNIAPYSSPSDSTSSSSTSSDSSTSPTSTTSVAPSSTATATTATTSAVGPSNTTSDADKLSRLRARIANEILTSETNYVESLSTLLGCFLQPLQASCNSTDTKPIITEEQLSVLSSNINQIAQLNARFLSDIQDRIESWTEETCLGPLFLEFAHFFKIYTWYVSNHDQTVMCLQQLEANARWRDFGAEVMKKPRVRNLPLSSFLILPIQRIPRYKLLLSELLKHTPVEHPDHDALEKALGLVSNVAAHINDSVRANENRMKVREIQAQFIGANFVSPSRRYIRSGMMQKQCRSSVKTYLFVLFNDLLVYASKVVVTNKYKVHKEIEIDGVFRVVDVKDDEDSTKGGGTAGTGSGGGGAGSGGEEGRGGGSEERKDTMTAAPAAAAAAAPSSSDTPHRLYKFKIFNSAKSFIVLTSDPTIKQHWLADLRAVINERKKTIKLPPSSSFPASSLPPTHAPMFAGDHSSSTCQRCDKRFSLTVRKHHCRSCGKLCCAECLRGARMKVRGEEQAVRVCWKCAGREELRVRKEEERRRTDEREKVEKEKDREREASKEAEREQAPVEQDILHLSGILPAQ